MREIHHTPAVGAPPAPIRPLRPAPQHLFNDSWLGERGLDTRAVEADVDRFFDAGV